MRRADEKEEEEKGGSSWKDMSLDKIELGEIIGGGGVGIVYEGWMGKRRVAVKTLVSRAIMVAVRGWKVAVV